MPNNQKQKFHFWCSLHKTEILKRTSGIFSICKRITIKHHNFKIYITGDSSIILKINQTIHKTSQLETLHKSAQFQNMQFTMSEKEKNTKSSWCTENNFKYISIFLTICKATVY